MTTKKALLMKSDILFIRTKILHTLLVYLLERRKILLKSFGYVIS